MIWTLLICAMAQEQEVPIVEQAQEVHQVRAHMCAIESFLVDRKNHEELCPELEWDQPEIEQYKRDPSTKLPHECVPSPPEPPPQSMV